MAKDELPSVAQITAEVLSFPDKEFYPGFFDEFRRVKQLAAYRELYDSLGRMLAGTAPDSATELLKESAGDTSIKVHLICEHHLKQVRDRRANDNKSGDPAAPG
ncbi:MAG TPA: hypothetical protein VMO78_16045 [Rhizomicrobium sp.]|nr:hypothetical protein [Rhizomicrobium sp.]